MGYTPPKKIKIGKFKYQLINTLRGKYIKCKRDHLIRFNNMIKSDTVVKKQFRTLVVLQSESPDEWICNFCGYNFRTGEYMTDKKYPFPPPRGD